MVDPDSSQTDLAFEVIEELRHALASVTLDELERPSGTAFKPSPAACQAAFEVALWLGRAEVYGIDLGELDGQMPLAMIQAALLYADSAIEKLAAEVPRLGPLWDHSPEPDIEGTDAVCGVLQDSFDIWSAMNAIGESLLGQYIAGPDVEQTPEFKHVQAMLVQVRQKCTHVESLLVQEQELLTIACETNLLANLRANLLPEYRVMAPWWLMGKLETLAQQMESDQSSVFDNPRFLDAVRRLDQRNANRWLLGGLARPLAAAAAGSAAHAGPSLLMTRWRHEASGRTAELLVDTTIAEDAPVALAFFEADNSPARAMQGQSVALGGVAATIDAEGFAWFTKAQLRSGDGRGSLFVGSEKTPWELLPPTP